MRKQKATPKKTQSAKGPVGMGKDLTPHLDKMRSLGRKGNAANFAQRFVDEASLAVNRKPSGENSELPAIVSKSYSKLLNNAASGAKKAPRESMRFPINVSKEAVADDLAKMWLIDRGLMKDEPSIKRDRASDAQRKIGDSVKPRARKPKK